MTTKVMLKLLIEVVKAQSSVICGFTIIVFLSVGNKNNAFFLLSW